MQYHSNGKLMLTGEYLALDGAITLALPTKFGQSLQVEKKQSDNGSILKWNSINNVENSWFTAEIQINNFTILKTSDKKTAETLIKILKSAQKLSNKEVFESQKSYQVTTRLEFPRNWGLGSSSTLLNNIADWFEIDVLTLFFNVFNGSGYDVACAKSNTPILYQKKAKEATISPIKFPPDFSDKIYFVHLNQKQNSYAEIKEYQKKTKKDESYYQKVQRISEISTALTTVSDLQTFENLLKEHENIVAKILHQQPIQQKLFPDYQGGIVKSLGAWGGDFILVTGNKNDKQYFTEKGYKIILNYSDMIL